MKKKRIILWIFALVIGFSFQSCTNNTPDPNEELGEVNDQNSIEVLLAWNDLFVELNRYATGMRPNATSRAIAYNIKTSSHIKYAPQKLTVQTT